MVVVLLHEYSGWDIDYILDLSIARIRMLTANIYERRLAEFKQQAKLTEWSTKIIASTMAATTGKEGKELQKAVAKVKLDLDGSDVQEPDFDPSQPYDRADTVCTSAPGAENHGLPDYVIHGSRVANNKAGSAEALLSGFKG
jgi:hypothetical protein